MQVCFLGLLAFSTLCQSVDFVNILTRGVCRGLSPRPARLLLLAGLIRHRAARLAGALAGGLALAAAAGLGALAQAGLLDGLNVLHPYSPRSSIRGAGRYRVYYTRRGPRAQGKSVKFTVRTVSNSAKKSKRCFRYR